MPNNIPLPSLTPFENRLPLGELILKCSRLQDPHRIVELLLEQSLLHQASDVYMDNTTGEFKIFFRLHGSLVPIALYQESFARQIVDALKIKAHVPSPACGKQSVQEGHYSSPLLHRSIPVYIIPFSPLESVVIHLPCSMSGTSTNHKPTSPARDIEKKIFIWQMGKVGSTSIFNSLKGLTPPTSWDVAGIVADDHWLVHNNLLHTHSIQMLYNFLHYSDEEFIVISLVRDLIARNVSSVFESMCRNASWNKLFIAEQDDFIKLPYQKQEDAIREKILSLNSDDGLLNWYNKLFRSHFYYPDTDKYLIDIYSKKFDHDNGVQTYSSNDARVKMIILRLENLNESEKTIGDFLGINNFKLVKDNLSKDKWYKPIYEKFLSRYTPSEEEINRIYQSKFMQYYYSPSQIDTMIARWTKTNK